MMGPDYTHWMGAVDTVMDKLGRMIDWYETQKKLRGETPMLSTMEESSEVGIAKESVEEKTVRAKKAESPASGSANFKAAELTAGSIALLAALAIAGKIRRRS